jgi:hypothetical protein
MKSLKIANGQPEAVNRSRIDNTIVKRKGKTKQKGRQNKREDKTKEINPKNTKHKTKG